MRFAHLIAAAGCVAFAVGGVGAQSPGISGTIKGPDAPIVGATVRLLELDRVVRTGTGGSYTFVNVPPGTYTVYAGLYGYGAMTRPITVERGTATLDFNLRESALPLAEVVVSAAPTGRTPDQLYQSAASKGTIEFQNSGGASFAEKLTDLPGVTARLNGSATARPIVRGLGDNEVLVLENGLRMGDLATFDPAHATPISAASITQVDVVRGPATILYGPNTIGGLVNVITNLIPTASDHAMSGMVLSEFNSGNDGYASYFNNIFTSGANAFRVSAGVVNSSNIRIPANGYEDEESGTVFALDRLPQTFNRSSEFGAGWSTQGDWGYLGLGGKHYEMDYGIPGVPANPNWLNAPPGTSRIKQDRNTFELRGLWRVNGSFLRQLKLDASYNDYGHSEFPTQQDSSGVSSPQANHFHKRAFNAALQFQHAPVAQWQGTLGLWTNIEDLTIEGDQPLGPNSLTTGFAAYAFEEYVASAATRIQAGARFDINSIQTRPYLQSTDSVFQTHNQSRSSNAFTASVGVIQQFTPTLSASFNVARSFRAPTVQELFADGLDAASGTYSLGTASLAPEVGTGLDASLKGVFDNVTFEVTPFANWVNNFIYGFLRGDTIQGLPVRKFTSANALLLGAEAAVTVVPLSHLALRASVDAVRGTDTDANVYLPFMPPIRGLLRATWQDSRWMAMAEWRGASDQKRLGEGDTFTGGYGLMNLGVGVRLVQGAVVHNVSLRADNVFNRDYRDHLSVIKDFLPMPGFALRLNYQVVY